MNRRRAHRRHAPRRRLLALSLVVATGCGSLRTPEQTAGADGPTVTVTQARSSPREDGPRALDPDGALQFEDPSFPTPLVTSEDIQSGGPGPDGIPPIDAPKFIAARDVDFLDDSEPVIALTVGRTSRAYPLQILIWHEIVNDTIDGVPVAVTYCPLCNSAYVWDRRVGDRILDFGTSGKLWNSSLVMYDRQSGSLWGHFTGQAIAGRLTNTLLEPVPATITSWEKFRSAHPRGLVLSRDTGSTRPYGDNPYPGYDDVDNPPFLFNGTTDPRLPAKERVVGVADGPQTVAIVRSFLTEQGAVPFELGDRKLVALWAADTTSALDAGTISESKEVGSVNVVDVTSAELTIEGPGSKLGTYLASDGTSFDVLGRAVAGPRTGTTLPTATHVDTFWFAWGAFRPDTRVIDSPR